MTRTDAHDQDRQPIESPAADEIVVGENAVARAPSGDEPADVLSPDPEITVGMGTVAGLGCVGFIVVMVIILAVIFYGPHLR